MKEVNGVWIQRFGGDWMSVNGYGGQWMNTGLMNDDYVTRRSVVPAESRGEVAINVSTVAETTANAIGYIVT